jgi:D-serine dehydratase
MNRGMIKMNEKYELIASKEFKTYEDMYKIVDFCNKNLGDAGFTFGLSERDGVQVISIYKLT